MGTVSVFMRSREKRWEVASMIKGKTPEEIRKQFNIVNDFTPEEEAQAPQAKTALRRFGMHMVTGVSIGRVSIRPSAWSRWSFTP